MVCGNDIALVSVALTLTLAVAVQDVHGQQGLRHPGQVLVIDSAGKKPIEADVKAWPESKETGRQGDCPIFGKAPLDATRSSSGDGRFALKVDAKWKTYTTTYCANGVFPRADPDLWNFKDGAAIVPTPVELYARDNDPGTYERVVEQKMIGLMNDLAYYQTINADGFKTTVNKLSSTLNERDPNRAKILRDLGSVVPLWKR